MKKLFSVFLLLGAAACAEEKVKMPPGLIPEGQLTSIMADIHVLESQVDAMQLQPDTARAFFNKKQEEVLKKHQVSKADFDSTYTFYLNNIRLLDNIYERLVDTLSMREIKLTKGTSPNTPPAQPAQNDSKLIE